MTKLRNLQIRLATLMTMISVVLLNPQLSQSARDVSPRSAGPVAGDRSYHPPPLSGIFQAASNFANDSTAPGQGAITKSFCTNGTDLGGGNIRINCDSIQLPHNELSIAVNPANPNHIVAGSNDYELFSIPGGPGFLNKIIAGYYTSTDGGTTWLNGHIDPGGFFFSGDPSIAFNKKLGLVHYATVGFNLGAAGAFTEASVQVNTSKDGGLTFERPTVLAHGIGSRLVQIFNDKPYIAVDNNSGSSHYGRLYVTYTRFVFGVSGYERSPIFFSYSDDGGNSFSKPKEISGNSATLCHNSGVSSNMDICNEDQFSVPVVGPDGTLYVAFENGEFEGSAHGFRGQYLVVRSTDGGQTFEGPFQAVFPIFDGSDDYPRNVDGRQTLSNSQFRINSAGNITVDPTSGPAPSSTNLYIAFSDNRNGTLTGDFSTVATNTDIVVVKSSNGGTSWNAPVVLASARDQFYPWAAVDSDGNLRVAFSDRNYDSSNIQYGETLASSFNGGTSFSLLRVDTGLSNPNDSRFQTDFTGGTTNGKALFIGDYNGLDIGSDLVVHPAWTDMRTTAYTNPPPGTGHKTQDAVTASVHD
jgi:hypothetical protein